MQIIRLGLDVELNKKPPGGQRKEGAGDDRPYDHNHF